MYQLQHDTIVFSSASKAAVETVRDWVGHITESDIKSGDIQQTTGITRRRLLIDMSLKGNSPLTFEYLNVLEKVQAFRDSVLSRHKGKSLVIAKAAVNDELAAFTEKLKEQTGWVIAADYGNGGR